MTSTVYFGPVSKSHCPIHLNSRVLGLQASGSCLGVHRYFYRCVKNSQTEQEQGKFYTRGLEDEREGGGGKRRAPLWSSNHNLPHRLAQLRANRQTSEAEDFHIHAALTLHSSGSCSSGMNISTLLTSHAPLIL